MIALVVLAASPTPAEARQGPDAVSIRLDRAFNRLAGDEENTRIVREEVPESAWLAIESRRPAVEPEASPADPGAMVDREQYRGLMAEDLRRFGAWSLIPAVVALGLAFATRNVLLSLFAGVVAGAVVQFFQARWVTGAWVFWELDFIGDFFLRALGTPAYATILLIYLWFLGGILGVWGKTGAARHFAQVVGAKIVRGPRTARLFGWIIGMVFHQGGTVSTVLAGSTVRPVSDRHRVSHEELSYIVDSTASPVATILPFNAWPAYVGGLVAGATAVELGNFTLIPDVDAGISWFFRAVPFNFYSIVAVTFTLLFSLGWLPWYGGKMRRAVERARSTGQLDAHGARPLVDIEAMEGEPDPDYRVGLEDFLVPLGLLLSLAIVPLLFFQVNMINQAFFAATAGAIVLATAKGMRLETAMEGFLDGCRNMTVGAIILGLAVTLGQVSKDLDTAGFIVSAFGGWLPAWLLPALLTLSCMIISFSIGSSWGTYAVIFPIAVPLALSLAAQRIGADPAMLADLAADGGERWESITWFVLVCFGAVIGGAVFGDQCSPISDTTVLSSMFTGCDLMDHVTTQAPISLVAAGLGIVLSTLLVLIH